MPVVTISRGSYSGGKMLAECLAGKLGYRCIDRDLIIKRAAASGVSEEELRAALEKPPSFLGATGHTKYIYLTLVQAALTEEVGADKVVYHGLAGHLLLKEAPHLIRTRIIAPMEFRIRMVQDRLHLERGEAISHIEKMDQTRRKWTQFLYGVDWGDASLYDLVVNLERMSIEQACDVIARMTRQKCFAWTAERREVMQDLMLASRIRVKLALDPATSDLELQILSRQGTVSIQGEVAGIDQATAVGRIARSVPGAKRVELKQLELVTRF
jgi:cytidylate kinase